MNIAITDETTVIRMYVRNNYSIHNEPHEMKIKKCSVQNIFFIKLFHGPQIPYLNSMHINIKLDLCKLIQLLYKVMSASNTLMTNNLTSVHLNDTW